MSFAVTFHMNDQGQMIFSRNGRLLCSPRDPQREAQSWLQRQRIDSSDKAILVLGLGAGYHLQELHARFPDAKIDVLELHGETSLAHKPSGFVSVVTSGQELLHKDYDVVLSFRPAWCEYEALYIHHLLLLTQRSDDAILQAAEAKGMVTTASTLQSRKSPFTMKDLSFPEGDGADQEIKMWRCLRELVA